MMGAFHMCSEADSHVQQAIIREARSGSLPSSPRRFVGAGRVLLRPVVTASSFFDLTQGGWGVSAVDYFRDGCTYTYVRITDFGRR